MAAKRTVDTGRKDALGRTIRESGLNPARAGGSLSRRSARADFTGDDVAFDASAFYVPAEEWESPAVCDIVGLARGMDHVEATVVTSGDAENVVVALRGLPGSGKSSIADAWLAMDDGRMLLNRDNFRQTMYGKPWGLAKHQEDAITGMVHGGITRGLAGGDDVIIDETMLPRRRVREIGAMAVAEGADFVVITVDPPLDEVLSRAAARADSGGRDVPVEVIRGMAKKFGPLSKQAPLTLADVSPQATSTRFPAYECRSGNSTPTVLFDIDGTLANMTDRSPFDWHRVEEDEPNEAVISQLRINRAAGHDVVIMSGRDAVSREGTERWLAAHGIEYDRLLMRPAGDTRKDSVVKRELLGEVESGHGPVVGVYDDRDQVVSMWREVGLPCFQVNYGDF